MATLSITAASVTVAASATATKLVVQAGETITGGMPIYKKASDGLWYKMQADGTAVESGSTLDTTTQVGISLGGGTAGVWFVVCTTGPITIGATVVVGTHYYIHATAGLIGLFSDLASGNYITDIGYATTTAIISVAFNATGLTLA